MGITVAATVEAHKGEGFPSSILSFRDPVVAQLVTDHLTRQPGVRTVVHDTLSYNVIIDMPDTLTVPEAVAALLSRSITFYVTAEGQLHTLPVRLEVW
jgi:hypothetical protein